MKQKLLTPEQVKQNMMDAAHHQPIRLEGERLIKELANLILFFNVKTKKHAR